jgi:IS1 family transposase
MASTITPIVYYDRVDENHIRVGTGSWLIWLSKNSCFRYESFWGFFTACQEQQGEEIIWTAYRRVKEQLRCTKLGSNKNLTLDKLVNTAKQLSASDTDPWKGRRQIKQIDKTSTYQVSANFRSPAIEMDAVRQWCIFYNHPDGRVEFLGACWQREQALHQIQELLTSAHYSDSMSDLYGRTSSRYELREELVMPAGCKQRSHETNNFETNVTNQEVEIPQEVSELRRQLSELQKQLEQARQFKTNNDVSVKFIWN